MERLERAFRHGLGTTLHQARWVLPFYLASLGLGILQSWPMLLTGGAARRSPLSTRLARSDTDAVVDLFLGSPEAFAYVGVWTLVAVALVPIYGLVYNFWSGGIVSLAAGTHSFWQGCRRTFWSFTALGLLVILLMGLAGGVGALLGGLLGWGSLVLVAVLLALVNGLGEYARAAAAVHGRLNPFVLLGQAFGFCLRHLPGVLLLGLAGLLLHAALLGVYAWAAGRASGGLVAIVLQQLTALLFIWIKALRLSWATAYVRGAEA